ncbi:thrombospondin type-1 domain-containing protein, partial [Salmonella sp. s24813]|uniref:thrombospondin type-1 domain-containing protein n=1 Tax=Salmonella sp. s24813 TaxID=3159632 RepID=UPI0039816778
CPSPQWLTSPWSECSAKCGLGHQMRSEQGLSHTGLPSTGGSGESGDTLDESECHKHSRPTTRMRCNLQHCPSPQWLTSPWSECSAKCGLGHQMR